MERIPPFGLQKKKKKIDIEFVDGDEPRMLLSNSSSNKCCENARDRLEIRRWSRGTIKASNSRSTNQ